MPKEQILDYYSITYFDDAAHRIILFEEISRILSRLECHIEGHSFINGINLFHIARICQDFYEIAVICCVDVKAKEKETGTKDANACS